MVLLLFLAIALSAQEKPSEKCAISGTVVNSLTGDPLTKVEVRLQAAGKRQSATEVTTTDEDGKFTMVGIEPGSYHLNGRRNGYLETAYGARRLGSDGTILRLEAGQSLADLKLKLMPYAVISGTIRDRDGEPLADVRVTVGRISYQDGKHRLDGYEAESSNDLGQYRIRDLPPGKYYIGAKLAHENYRIDRSPGAAPREETVPTVYPGSADPAMAVAVEVRAGARVDGVDITMQRKRTFAVSGRVITASGAGTRASLALRQHDQGRYFADSDMHTEVQSTQGDFQFRGVPPGSYDIIGASGEFRARAPVQVGSANVDGVRVVLDAGAKVRIRVIVEGESKIEGAPIHAFLTTDGRQGTFLGVNGKPAMFGETSPTVSPDHYQVKLNGIPPNLYVKSVRAGQTDVLTNGVDVEPGGSLDLDVLLSDDGGKMEGTVTDSSGNPDTGAIVLLVPEAARRSRTDLFVTAETDQYGHFELMGVPPGDYQAFAFDDVETGVWFDPDFLRERKKHAVDVTVRPKQTETITVKTADN